MSDNKDQAPSEVKASEPPKITRVEKTDRPKDPKRVEAGKRLAAISRSAKEKKARDRENRAQREDHQHRPKEGDQPNQTEPPQSALSLDWTIPVGGLILTGLGGLYYALRNKEETKSEVAERREAPAPSKLDSFD